jgi:hypothetical protein
VLTVVEDDEQLLGAQELRDALVELEPGTRANAERRGDHLHHRVLVVGGCQLAEPRTVGEPGEHLGRELRREARLPHSADAGEGHEVALVERLRERCELTIAADEGREL